MPNVHRAMAGPGSRVWDCRAMSLPAISTASSIGVLVSLARSDGSVAEVGDLPVLADPLELNGDRDFLQRRSEEHTSELQSRRQLVCRLLLEKQNTDRTSY